MCEADLWAFAAALDGVLIGECTASGERAGIHALESNEILSAQDFVGLLHYRDCRILLLVPATASNSESCRFM